MNRLFTFLKTRAQGLFAAAGFAPLADYSQSLKFTNLYNDSQSLTIYLNSVFTVAISIGAIIAVVQLSIAGYLYMGGDVWHKKDTAKTMIRDVFFGLVLLLSIWIILHQINPNLLNLKIVFPDIGTIPPISTTPSAVRAPNQDYLDMVLRDETNERNILRSGDVGVNKAACSTVGQSNCTDVGLLGPNAIAGLLGLKNSCGTSCPVTVTGGTEWWLHSSHQPNASIVDIAKDPTLDKYIVATGTRLPDSTTFISGQVTPVYRLNGATYYSEDSAHWHVVY